MVNSRFAGYFSCLNVIYIYICVYAYNRTISYIYIYNIYIYIYIYAGNIAPVYPYPLGGAGGPGRLLHICIYTVYIYICLNM